MEAISQQQITITQLWEQENDVAANKWAMIWAVMDHIGNANAYVLTW